MTVKPVSSPAEVLRLDAVRERYAARLGERARLASPALVRAFATVKREAFLGPGPWKVVERFPDGYAETPDADPGWIYADVPVAIDPARLLNNGQPSFVGSLIDALGLREGEHVVQVGCGTGYYTAVIAEVVGQAGRVTAYEIDPDLASRARGNLAGYGQVEVVCADGGADAGEPGTVDAVLVHAGSTHPRPAWLDCLRPGGRLVLPLIRWPAGAEESAVRGLGILVWVARDGSGHAARVLSPTAFFPCFGGLDPGADRNLADAFGRLDEVDSVRSLRRDVHPRDATCWLHGDGYCLSLRPPT
jgi:protein-L-isoaspartate(D-aspartate) O-methyltransferase